MTTINTNVLLIALHTRRAVAIVGRQNHQTILLTPDAARELAAELIDVANLAEDASQVDRNKAKDGFIPIPNTGKKILN